MNTNSMRIVLIQNIKVTKTLSKQTLTKYCCECCALNTSCNLQIK